MDPAKRKINAQFFGVDFVKNSLPKLFIYFLLLALGCLVLSQLSSLMHEIFGFFTFLK